MGRAPRSFDEPPPSWNEYTEGDTVECDHCHAEVVRLFSREGERLGWLHPNGLLACGPRSTWPTKPLEERREQRNRWRRERYRQRREATA